MALSERAENIKAQLQQVVSGKRELEAIDKEWRDLVLLDEERLCEPAEETLAVIEEVVAEQQRMRKQVALWQLHNFVRLQRVNMTPLQRRVMRLRYVQGCTWGDIVLQTGKSKQYLLREHNKVLERMASGDRKVTQTAGTNSRKTAERCGKTA